MTLDRIKCCSIVAAHGIRGAVKCNCFLTNCKLIKQGVTLSTDTGVEYSVSSIRSKDNQLQIIVSFQDISDRNAAEAMIGTDLYISTMLLPKLNSDEFYLEDLVGCSVLFEENNMASVLAIHNFGSEDLLEISIEGSVFIPFRKSFFPEIDIKNKKITISTEGINFCKSLSGPSR